METLKKIKNEHQKMRALIIIFDEKSIPKKGKVYSELEKQRDENNWFDFVILRKDKHFLSERILRSLRLEKRAHN